jgi:hypothetical protein
MSTVTTTVPTRAETDATWLRLVQVCTAVAVVPLAIFAVVGTFFTTISGGGDFRYTADYWYTAVGLPITLIGIGIALGVHKLQHGADGRLATIGVWVNTVALIELFVQLLASVIEGAEVRWGPSYPVCALLSFVGVALLAAGSWRTGVLPRWVLGVWPLVWILGSLAAMGPTPLVLAAFLVLFGVTLTRRTRSRTV